MGLTFVESDSAGKVRTDNQTAMVRSFLDAEHEREGMHDEALKETRMLLHGRIVLEIPGDELQGHADQESIRYVRLERTWEGEAITSQFTGYDIILARKKGADILPAQTFHLGFFNRSEDTFSIGKRNPEVYPLNQDHYLELGTTLRITLEALGRKSNGIDVEGIASTITLFNSPGNSSTGEPIE